MLSLQANDIFDGNYLLLEPLGQGGFAEVWKVKNLNAELVQALKVYIGLDQSGSQVFRKEYARFYELNHPNLLTASNFGVYQNRPYLVMPYCPGGTALQRAGQVDENELARMLRDLSAGLMYLHELPSPVIHQDVKPDNFLINARGDYMLSDFGISTELRRTLVKSIPAGRATEQLHSAGQTPPAYRAPEFYSKDRQGSGAIIASDVWALGASLYEIATGHLPFHDLGGLSQMNGAPIPNLPAPFSTGLNQLLQRCMAEKPWERPSAREVNERVSAFLKEGSWREEKVAVTPLVEPETEKAAPVQTETRDYSFVGIIFVILVLAGSLYFGLKDQIDERFSGSGNSLSTPNYQTDVYKSPPDPKPKKESTPAPPAVISNPEQTRTSSSRDTKPTKTELRESSKSKSEEKTSNRIPDPIQTLQKDMVRVEGGSFTMGCKDGRDKDCYDGEKPTRKVEVSGFSIGKFEVTQAQWRAVMGSDPPELYNKGCDNCPVERVSWNDIQEFIQKLNVLTGKRYRLPTEAEWEYAARGGNKSRGYLYSGSNNIDEVAWYSIYAGMDNTYGTKKTTRPVGGKKSNELGLYDLSGNVWEWVQDWYDTYPFENQVDTQGPALASDRVLRGGSWFYDARYCRAASRERSTPAHRGGNIGYRLAL